MPKLRTLVLRQRALLGDSAWSPLERQWRYGQVATHFFQYIAKTDSRISSIHFTPPFAPENHVSEPDANGHRWPDYSYEIALLTKWNGGKVVKEIVAVPVPCYARPV